MVLLKNADQLFEHQNYFGSFLKTKEPDCILHSKEGIKLSVHKEIFYQTKFLREILMRANHMCCKKLEIFCPCSEDELEAIVTFLYCGSISFKEESYQSF